MPASLNSLTGLRRSGPNGVRSNANMSGAAIGLALVLFAPLLAHAMAGNTPGNWPEVLLVSAQAGVLAAVLLGALLGALARGARPAIRAPIALAAGGASFLLAVLACRARPMAGASLVAAACHGAIYGSLLVLFARSLLPGREAVATRLARRIHSPLTARRRRYTRYVTFAWSAYFACQCAASAALVHWPEASWAWLVRASDLPLAGLLMAGELAVRSWLFRGEPHATATDMMNAFRAGNVLAADDAKPR